MGKKDFDMSQLVSGLTGEDEMESMAERKVQSAAKCKKPMEHVCTLIATEQMAKVRTIEQRVVLRIIERAPNAINGIKLKDNMRKLDVGLRTAWPHGRGDGHSQDTSTFSILRRFCADFRF